MSSYSQSDIYHSIFSDIYTVFCGMQDCTPSYSFGPAVRQTFTRKESSMSSYSQSDIYHSIFSDIYTVFCGMQDCTPSYSFGPAVRDCYLLHLCLEGEGVFYSGEERYPIKQGQGFLIHPGKLTFYQADSVNPWSYLWVGIGGHDAEKYLRLAGLSVRHPVFSCTQIDTAKSYILDMMKHHALSTSNEIYIQGLLMQFLSLLVEEAGCTISPQQNTSSVYINQAISYIHKNYQNPLTVQEIADYLSLNRSYLTELFLKTVQLSPQQFFPIFIKITRIHSPYRKLQIICH